MLQNNKPLSHSLNKQQGFTLLELVIVIVIISILGIFAIDRIFAIRTAAEQASVKQLVGTIKSALGLEVAKLALKGNLKGVSQLANTNPMTLLSQKPNNYLEDITNINKKTGVWYFNKKQQALIYHVHYKENFSSTLLGVPKIRYQIKLIYNDSNNNNHFDLHTDGIGGLDFIPLEKYHWNVNAEK